MTWVFSASAWSVVLLRRLLRLVVEDGQTLLVAHGWRYLFRMLVGTTWPVLLIGWRQPTPDRTFSASPGVGNVSCGPRAVRRRGSG